MGVKLKCSNNPSEGGGALRASGNGALLGACFQAAPLSNFHSEVRFPCSTRCFKHLKWPKGTWTPSGTSFATFAMRGNCIIKSCLKPYSELSWTPISHHTYHHYLWEGVEQSRSLEAEDSKPGGRVCAYDRDLR